MSVPRHVVRPLTPEARAKLPRLVGNVTSPFRSTISQTWDLLDSELYQIHARLPFVLQHDGVEEHHIRLDGMLRADARTPGAAIAVAIDHSDKGPLLFVCGRFRWWHDNLRAIALGMEALRKVARYGITSSDEQYRGWQALPPGTPMPAAKMTVEEAARFLWSAADLGHPPTVLAAEYVRTAYRAASLRHHPDRGGDPATFRKVTEANDILTVPR